MKLLVERASSYTSCDHCDEDARYTCKECCYSTCKACNPENPCEVDHSGRKCGYAGICLKCIPKNKRYCGECDIYSCCTPCAWGNGRRLVKDKLHGKILQEDAVTCRLLRCSQCDTSYCCMLCQRQFCNYHVVHIKNLVLCCFCVEVISQQAQKQIEKAGRRNTLNK